MEKIFALDTGEDPKHINISIYKKMMPCPLRSQIGHVKTRMDQHIHDGPEDIENGLKLDFIQGFLKFANPEKLRPDLDDEIRRTEFLINELRNRKND